MRYQQGIVGAVAGIAVGALLGAGAVAPERAVVAEGDVQYYAIESEGVIRLVKRTGEKIELTGVLTSELGYDDYVRMWKSLPEGHLRQRFVPWRKVEEDVRGKAPDAPGEPPR